MVTWKRELIFPAKENHFSSFFLFLSIQYGKLLHWFWFILSKSRALNTSKNFEVCDQFPNVYIFSHTSFG